MSSTDKKDRIRNILKEIDNNTGNQEKASSGASAVPTISQTITGGSDNTQIAGNNNVVKR